MITLLFWLILTIPDYTIVGPGAVSYAPLEQVVTRRGWEGTEAFEVLVAPPNCRYLARQGWLIAGGKVLNAVVVDCENPLHRGQMAQRGLLADTNRKELVGEKGWLVIR